jgi:hypothetical protein
VISNQWSVMEDWNCGMLEYWNSRNLPWPLFFKKG